MRHFQRFLSLTFVLVAFALLTVSPAVAADRDNAVDRYLSAYSSGDMNRVVALYTDDMSFVDVSQRHKAEGREEMKKQLDHLRGMHKTMKVEEKRRATSGRLVSVEVVYSGTLDCAALGLPGHEDVSYEIPAVLLFELEGERIRRQTDYLDYRTILELRESLKPPAAPAG